MASPFHAATTLSSRAGRTRWRRRASSTPRTWASRSASLGSARRCSTERPCSNVPEPVTLNASAAHSPSCGPQCVGQLGRSPGIEEAFRAVAVRVQRGGQPAFRGAQLIEHPLAGFGGHPAGQRRPGAPPQVRVHPGQQRVVVEHLLEVRHHPAGVRRVAGEAAGQLVVHAAAGHRLGGALGHGQRLRGTRPAPFGVPEQELQHHGRRELGRAAEAALRGVVVPGQRAHRLVGWPRPGRPAAPARPHRAAAWPARPAPRRSHWPGW